MHPLQKCFVTASLGHYSQRATRIGQDHIDAGSDFLHLNSDSVPFFQRRPGPYCEKPTQIRSGGLGQVLAKHIWPRNEPVCKNHQALFLVQCNQPTTSFPLSNLVVFFTDSLDHNSYGAKTALIQFGSGWLCLVLAKWIWSGSKLVCKIHPACFWPMLLSRSGSDV